MRRALARCLAVLPLTAVVLAACEQAVTTVKGGVAAPPVVAPRASVANGLPLGLTGNIAVDSFSVCSVGADGNYSWSNSGWPAFTAFNGTQQPAGAATSGNAAVADGGATAPAAWASGNCQVVYTYPLPAHTGGLPVVTATWQPQPGIRLDSIIKDSVKAQNLLNHTGPLETILPALTSTSSVAGVVNNDYGSIAFFYFTKLPSLQLVKTADAASVQAGQQIGFSMVVTNNGPGVANVVTLTDALPTGSGLSWSVASPATGCTISAGVLTCSLGPLAASASATVHIVSPTTTASCASYSNTASAVADQESPVQGSASTTVVCPPNLSVSKVADAATVSAGSPIGFTITATNAGPGTAQSVTLSDPLPTGTGLSWSISPANAACAISAGVLTCSFGDLAANSSVSVHVTSPTTAQSCAAYPNTATAQGTGTPVVQASASTTVECPSLTLTKTADAASVTAGSPVGFTMTVTSGGPGTATGVTLSDPLPGGLTWSVDAANSTAGCSISGGTLSCTFGDLAAAASAHVHVTAPTTSAACGTLNNTATAQSTNGGNAQASASTSVVCPPSLTVTKTADAASVTAGSSIGFTITVASGGPGTATGVTLSDVLPTGSGISWSVSPSNAACSITSGTLSCSFGDLASGASASVHVSSPTTAASCALYNNTAAAQSSNGGSGQGSASTTVVCPPSLSITKTADAASVKAGNPIGFTVTVTSGGPGTATGVTLSDPLPTGTGISWSLSPSVSGCSISGGVLSCSFGSLAAGQVRTVHLTSPTMNGSCGTYSNTATVASTNATGGQASASTSVTGCLTVCTATMGGWGQNANGNNIGAMRDAFFSTVYLSGVNVGTSTRYIRFTSAAAVNTFLPATGGIGVLDKSYTNPTTTPALVFGGQVTALRLNIDFSNAQVNGWKPGLASALVASGPLAGKTVAQVLTIAQGVLAGGALPSGMTLGDLNNLVSAINGTNSPDGCGYGDGTIKAP